MPQISDAEFDQLTEYIKRNYGITMGHEKQALLVGRLQNVLSQNNFPDFSAYFEYIISDDSGDAVETLVNKITTNHTFFMRETSHFNFLRDQVLPALTKSIKDKDLRIWSAGCSSGEEPYTLAMLLSDYFGKDKALWNMKILATDLSNGILTKARKGVYSKEQIEPLPSLWKMTYFKKTNGDEFELEESIKNEVAFRRFNLMDEVFPFKKKFQVIFCRNVMIYFDAKTKKELIEKFYNMTETGGYLFIGQSETVNREDTKYNYIMPAVYRK